MTPEEICKDYRQAKKPKQQIKILAELNLCTPEEITAILQDAGELKSEAVKGNKEETKKRLIELFEQGYSNAEIAEQMGLTRHQVAIRLTWLKKEGRISDGNLATAKSENKFCAGSETSVIYATNRIMSLLSTMNSIPQTQVLSFSIRITDDRGKSWRLDLQEDSGENSL